MSEKDRCVGVIVFDKVVESAPEFIPILVSYGNLFDNIRKGIISIMRKIVNNDPYQKSVRTGEVTVKAFIYSLDEDYQSKGVLNSTLRWTNWEACIAFDIEITGIPKHKLQSCMVVTYKEGKVVEILPISD